MLSVTPPLEDATARVHVLAKKTMSHPAHSNNEAQTPKHQSISELVKDHLKLLEEITTRFSEAVNDQAYVSGPQENEAEKIILLSLCEKFAAVKDKIDLYDLVVMDICPLFSASGFIIAVRQGESPGYATLMLHLPETAGVKPTDDETQTMYAEFDPHHFKNITDSSQPIFYTLAECGDDDEHTAFWDMWKLDRQSGIIGIALKTGDKVLGCLILQISDKSAADLRMDLLKGITQQLSLSVSNILSLDEIVKRESERDLLLSLNTDIATVRNGDELEVIIRRKLKNLLSCSHTSILTVNEDRVTASAFLLDPETKAKNHPDYQTAKCRQYSIQDGVLDQSAATSTPLFFDLKMLAEQQDMPLYAQINFESGLRQLVISRFTKGNEVFGFWMLYFEKGQIKNGQHLDLIQSLANQISVAVANIMANQEIKDREEEKTRLLKFSDAIASVREREVLSKILTQQLNELFGLHNYMIHGLNEEGSKQNPLFYDPEGAYASSISIDSWTDVNNGIFNVILETDGPVSFNLDNWIEHPDLQEYTNRLKGWPEPFLIGIRIRLGSENIAVMTFTHGNFQKIKKQEYLLKSICSQIAIAISNIIANEQVNRQLSEINNYKQRLEEETVYLKEEIQINQNYAEIIGESLSMQKTFRLVSQVASSDSTVLILGETGTGKELVARAIHNNSMRKGKLMVKVNCAALPANLIESELFGHERGSFTGATERRIGKFELANNGTLFLDEIGEMPLELQVKLLRALQEKEIERVGGKGTIKVDVRIIAATNRNLEMEMEEGRFRSDLFYRLNIFPIYLDALRDRKEDIPALATHFIHRYSKKVGKKITTLNNKVMQDLLQYNWPGNIRELEHLIERSVLLTTGDTLKQIHLPSNKVTGTITVNAEEIQLRTIDENERIHILNILRYCKGRISGTAGAADILGLPTSTLNSKIKRLGIRKEHLG